MTGISQLEQVIKQLEQLVGKKVDVFLGSKEVNSGKPAYQGVLEGAGRVDRSSAIIITPIPSQQGVGVGERAQAGKSYTISIDLFHISVDEGPGNPIIYVETGGINKYTIGGGPHGYPKNPDLEKLVPF